MTGEGGCRQRAQKPKKTGVRACVRACVRAFCNAAVGTITRAHTHKQTHTHTHTHSGLIPPSRPTHTQSHTHTHRAHTYSGLILAHTCTHIHPHARSRARAHTHTQHTHTHTHTHHSLPTLRNWLQCSGPSARVTNYRASPVTLKRDLLTDAYLTTPYPRSERASHELQSKLSVPSFANPLVLSSSPPPYLFFNKNK